MSTIPDITSPVVGLYLQFIEWNMDKEKWVSPYSKETTKQKQLEIQDMILLGASFTEVDFLFSIEEDQNAKKLLKKALFIFKNKKN